MKLLNLLKIRKDTMVLLEYRNVSKSFGKAQVLRDINLKIPSGKIIGLLGKNGTGKSTLIKLANDLLTPNSGEVLFMNQPVDAASKLQIAYLSERTYSPSFMITSTSKKPPS